MTLFLSKGNHMFAELLHQSPLLVLPIVGFGLFATLFAAAVAFVCSKSPEAYREVAELPLRRDGDPHG
jgi:hypothetical protein